MQIIELDKFPGMEFVKVSRVAYGKKNLPQKKREYKASGEFDSPVGTVSEWVAFIRRNKSKLRFDGIVCVDHLDKKWYVYNTKGELIGEV